MRHVPHSPADERLGKTNVSTAGRLDDRAPETVSAICYKNGARSSIGGLDQHHDAKYQQHRLQLTSVARPAAIGQAHSLDRYDEPIGVTAGFEESLS